MDLLFTAFSIAYSIGLLIAISSVLKKDDDL